MKEKEMSNLIQACLEILSRFDRPYYHDLHDDLDEKSIKKLRSEVLKLKRNKYYECEEFSSSVPYGSKCNRNING